MAQFDHKDFRIVEKIRTFQGYFAIDEYQIEHKLFNGGWSQTFSRELFERGDASAVILFDPEREAVVLLEQFRVGALNSEHSPWMIEIVAGIIEAGETSESVAIREAKEEAGQDIEQLEYIGKYYSTPGGSSESISLFCARVDSSSAGGVFGLEHEQEDIRVFTMTLNEVESGLNRGLIENATTIIAMQWLLLNHQRLKKQWLIDN